MPGHVHEVKALQELVCEPAERSCSETGKRTTLSHLKRGTEGGSQVACTSGSVPTIPGRN